MKKIVSIILFTLFIIQHNSVIAEYNQDISISKAILVETYIIKHKERIKNFIKKYKIQNSKTLENDIKELDESIIALAKIKNWKIISSQSEDIINAIIQRIKIINENLKINLNKQKLHFEHNLKKKKKSYSLLWLKISKKIDAINIKIAKALLKTKNTNISEKNKIKNHLIKLNKESKKLKYFWNINFKSEKEIKDSFVRILNNIKREVNEMKKSLK